jgi:hypothetical protein
MDKLALKAELMASISEEIDLWLEKSESIKEGSEYETEFITMTQKINKLMLTKSLGNVSSNRNNKKNFRPVLGRLQ